MNEIVIKDSSGKVIATLEVEWPKDKLGGLVRLIEATLDEASDEEDS